MFLSLTISRDVVFVCLGSLECGSTSEKLVSPLSFVRAVNHLVVGLSLIGVVWCMLVGELAKHLEIISLSNQPMMDTLKKKDEDVSRVLSVVFNGEEPA